MTKEKSNSRPEHKAHEEDFRTVSDAIRSLYRKKTIALIKEEPIKKGEVTDLFGENKNTVSNW